MPNVSGLVADRMTGKPLPGVTIWAYSPDGRSATVLGYSDSEGDFEIPINGVTIAFEKDGYTGMQIPDDMINEAGTVTMNPTLKTLAGFPAWLWEVVVIIGIYFLSSGKKRK
jgi:hypothetical protein